jgi:hypothetical protein
MIVGWGFFLLLTPVTERVVQDFGKKMGENGVSENGVKKMGSVCIF